MKEKVDMTADDARAAWVSRQTALGVWMEEAMALLGRLDKDGRKETDVQDMRDAWDKRWTFTATNPKMTTKVLKKLGWILDVRK